MPSPTIRGALTPFRQNRVWNYDPQRGVIYREDYRGASQALMYNLWLQYMEDGLPSQLTFHQGDTASLELEDPSQAYTLDVWQVVGNEEARDSLSHPSVLNVASEDQIGLLRQHLENQDKPSVAFADAGLAALAGTSIQRRYSRIQSGQTEYRRGQYVLRHTTNAPARWNVNIADFGVDCIYTSAQLLTEATNPALWIYPLPARLQYKILNLPAPSARSYYLWGWLKSASTETTAANNRIEIATEYTLEQWSTDDYAPY